MAIDVAAGSPQFSADSVIVSEYSGGSVAAHEIDGNGDPVPATRRLMISEDASASRAAFAVGYESVSQFTREYGRMFGLPPVQDAKAVRDKAQAVA